MARARVRPGRLLGVLPPGTVPVGAGLLVNGVSAYGFLVLSARALGPERYVGISVLWALTFLVSFGFFIPFELEAARAVADRAARGIGAGSVVRQATRIGGVILAAILVTTLVTAPVLLDTMFDDQVLLLVSLDVALVSYFFLHMARGVLSGARRLGTYGVVLAVEGGVRFMGCLALFLGAVRNPGAYGAAFTLGPLAALALTLRHKRLEPGPHAPLSEVSTAIGYLMASSVLSQALVNGPAVVVKALSTRAEQASAGRFLAALVVARVPLFLFTAVQVALLPNLASLAVDGNLTRFRAELRRLSVLVLTTIALSILGIALVGPWVMRVFFGPEFSVSRVDLIYLATASGAFLMALAWAQALIALGRHARVALGWFVGVIVFAAAALGPWSVITRVEMAFLSGSLTAALALGALVLTAARGPDGVPGTPFEPVPELPGP
ncbi:MAG: hypothetical protein M3378_06425 [Actinomycetota bacterium]|nr:hypothetical protein [Actinomycetota bacterium]